MKTNYTIDFEFKELGLELKENKKKVLAGVTGQILHGRVTAVMGPSGAGKTTFLSTLSGKVSQGNIIGDVYPIAQILLEVLSHYCSR
jgi:ABC-type multidrug transport system ATPase subunit